MRNKITLIVFLTIVCSIAFGQQKNIENNKNQIFYDFKVTIRINGGISEDKFVYLINHDSSRNVLRYESFVPGNGENGAGDTIVKTLKNIQLDSIYELTRNIFSTNPIPSKYSSDNIRIPIIYDGSNAKVIFDLGGDSYEANICHADEDYYSNKAFIKLYFYLERIIKKT